MCKGHRAIFQDFNQPIKNYILHDSAQIFKSKVKVKKIIDFSSILFNTILINRFGGSRIILACRLLVGRSHSWSWLLFIYNTMPKSDYLSP